ncbi:hypothetical protein XA68_11660 [Ophiocordyceps unilateralis]|uniref:Uncharacterized protein n=1 Tax=Ophiocordyceps unilateralis TaxID=268505 RepID=A0A2A9PG09_OPHUN|nr:hypothetical protein XA68_11660 [Ophiocordyceps unilateralis]
MTRRLADFLKLSSCSVQSDTTKGRQRTSHASNATILLAPVVHHSPCRTNIFVTLPGFRLLPLQTISTLFSLSCNQLLDSRLAMDDRRAFIQRRRDAANVFLALTVAFIGCCVVYWFLAKRRLQSLRFTKQPRAHEMGGFHQDAGPARGGTLAILPAYGETLPSTPPPAYGSWTGRLLRPLTLLPGRGSISSNHNSNSSTSTIARGGGSRNNGSEEANVGLEDTQGRKEQSQQSSQ